MAKCVSYYKNPSVLELKFAKQISELPTVIPVKAGIQKLVTRLPAMPYAMNKGQEKKVLDNRQRTAVNRATMGKKAIILLVSLTLASSISSRRATEESPTDRDL